MAPAPERHTGPWTPKTPDSGPQTEEFRPVVILNGREHGRREQVDVCEEYAYAVHLAQIYATNVGHGATWTVLRRTVGEWEEAR